MNNDWLDIDVLEDYLDGKLDTKTMHFVERQALEDPFVAEALEGLSQSPKRKQHLSILQKQLQERLAQKPIKRKLWGINTQRLSIAATATVAFIVVSILFILRETNRRNAEIAQRKENGIVISLDSNTKIAAAPSSSENKDSARQQAVVADALAKAKTSDLAVNRQGYKNENSAKKLNNKEAAIVAAAPEYQAPALASRTMQSAEAYSAVAAKVDEPSNFISGKVIEEGSGSPISGAHIKIVGSNLGAVTDAKGNYSLKVDSLQKDKSILISSVGYKTKKLALDNQHKNLNIVLADDATTLNEVAVVSVAKQANKNIASSAATVPSAVLAGKVAGLQISDQPISTEDFNDYLSKNNQLIKAGYTGAEVVLTFRVSNNGKPRNIKIVVGASDQQNNEAIRLVKDGPKWKKVKDDSDTVRLTIKF